MCEDNTNSAVTVKGTFMGQPIDLTVTECEVPAESVDQPGVTDLTDAAPETAVDTPETTDAPKPSDPPPAEAPVSDEPKNPAGNSEQV